MTVNDNSHLLKFFELLEFAQNVAMASRVGKLMTANDFTIDHTGGGCLAWHKSGKDHYAWVTVDGTGLGAEVVDLDARVFDVGLYANDDGDTFVNPEQLMSAIEAIAWCEAALADPKRYL
jgi:hypothetical protein